jgi:hypothetical protein
VERDNEKEKSKAVKTSATRAAKVPYVDQLKLYVHTLGKQVNLEETLTSQRIACQHFLKKWQEGVKNVRCLL